MRRSILFGVGALAVIALAIIIFIMMPNAAPNAIDKYVAQAPAFDGPVSSSAVSIATGTPRTTPAAGYSEYRNTTYGFSLFYPSDLSVNVNDDGDGATTVVFQDTKTVRGFQLFIVPYSGTQVTEQRFEEDEPSGVRNDVTTGLINGTPAAAFYSTDPRLGDTYEVWFIHGGYLYEATTLKPLEPWFQSVMQTWKFI